MQDNDIQPCDAVMNIIRILFCGRLREKRPIDSGLRDRDPVKPCKRRCICCEECLYINSTTQILPIP